MFTLYMFYTLFIHQIETFQGIVLCPALDSVANSLIVIYIC